MMIVARMPLEAPPKIATYAKRDVCVYIWNIHIPYGSSRTFLRSVTGVGFRGLAVPSQTVFGSIGIVYSIHMFLFQQNGNNPKVAV